MLVASGKVLGEKRRLGPCLLHAGIKNFIINVLAAGDGIKVRNRVSSLVAR